MPRVTVELGLTLKLPNQDFGVFKPTVVFGDIDTEGDVAAQLERCREVAAQTADAAEQTLAQVGANLSGYGVEGFGLTAELTEFKEQVKRTVSSIVTEVKRQKDVLETLAGQKPAKPNHRKKQAEEPAGAPEPA